MKRIAVCLLMMLLLSGCACAGSIDIDALSVEELILLESRIESALMGAFLTKDNDLPFGKYVAGDDIAAGRYVITASKENILPNVVVQVYDQKGHLTEEYTLDGGDTCKVTLKDGMAVSVDSDHVYGSECHASIQSFAGFLIQSNGYSLAALETPAPEKESAHETMNELDIPEAAEGSVYTFFYNKHNFYKAYALPGGLINIENWYREFSYEDFKQNRAVTVINTKDGSSDFAWLDGDCNAFTVTLDDPEVSETPFSTAFVLGDKSYE